MTGSTPLGRIDRALDWVARAIAPYIEAYVGDAGPPSGTFNRLDRVIDGVILFLSSTLLITITALTTYSIVMRYAFSRPPLWSEEVPVLLFVWMTFLSLAVATRRGENIRITYFIEKLSPAGRLVLELVMHALVIAMMALIFWYSFDVIRLQLRGTMLSTGWNQAVIWFPLPFGMALMSLYQFKRVRESIRVYRLGLVARGRHS